MHVEFNELNTGDVIELDRTIYTYGVSASGSLVMVGQHGDQNDQYEFDESCDHLKENPELYPQVKPCFGYSAQPLPIGKIGEDGEKLSGKKFVVISARPDGVPEEEMYHTGLEQANSGQMVVADEVIINEYNELYQEGDICRLRLCFYQGQGYEHRINFPKVIGNAPVKRTYTIGAFKPTS